MDPFHCYLDSVSVDPMFSDMTGARRVFEFAHNNLRGKLASLMAKFAKYGYSDFVSGHWFLVAAFQNPATRAASMRMVQRSNAVPMLLELMITAQFGAIKRWGKGSLTLHCAAARVCDKCSLLGQAPWFDTFSDLLAMVDGLSRLPDSAHRKLQQMLQHQGHAQIVSWCRQPYPCPGSPRSCTAHFNEFAERELIRILVRFDLNGFLDILSRSGCPLVVDFWRQVPDCAIDAVRDAAWVQREISSCSGAYAQQCIEELKRVAPVGSRAS
ncbi:hypothetical protein H9P43_005905 [Blastocladiella emersonii ATCC 22665]|nr:hypothetical protein H9P43_005905 [Blastocladiella emersonii ATCC 22665]